MPGRVHYFYTKDDNKVLPLCRVPTGPAMNLLRMYEAIPDKVTEVLAAS